ncbi:MAG: hypothetical protein HF973_08045 [Chloroflexi bacterium]|nr:hypothetical protein [Chloroflexota bacterium]
MATTVSNKTKQIARSKQQANTAAPLFRSSCWRVLLLDGEAGCFGRAGVGGV